VAEDADLTIAIRRLGWRVTYDEEAIAWTEAPETPGQLIRQRFRWTFGTLQSFWKHSDTLFHRSTGRWAAWRCEHFRVSDFVLPLVSPVLDLLFLGSLVLWDSRDCTSRRYAVVDDGGRAAFRGVFPGIPAD